MNHYIWVEVKTNHSSRILMKLFKQQIEVEEVSYLKDGIQFKILREDYVKLKKIVGYRFRKVRDAGLFHWKHLLRLKWLVFTGILLFVLFILAISHVIVDVKVIHSNREIRTIVTKALEEHGIKKLTIKKDFSELEQIKAQILQEYPEQLEWLEIEVSGMRYIVRIEERIITVPEEKKERCHIVATKSAIVHSMMYSAGEAKVAVRDFVSAGDILISGSLMVNENVTSSVCATGNVYGEVWYTTKISLPMNYEKKQETGKKRWNFMVSKGDVDTFIFRPRVEHYVNEKKRLFSIFGYEFYFVIQKEVNLSMETYSSSDALTEAMRLVDEKFQAKLSDQEFVLDKKVLKKAINNSTMDIEVFVSVIENISKQEEFQEIKEEG